MEAEEDALPLICWPLFWSVALSFSSPLPPPIFSSFFHLTHKSFHISTTIRFPEFGMSCSLDGDHLLVGTPGAYFTTSESGMAYLFYRNRGGPEYWGQQLQISAISPSGAAFGCAVSISGNWAMIGSVGNAVNAGRTTYLSRTRGGDDNWGRSSVVLRDDPQKLDLYSGSLWISGEFAIVGAQGAGSGPSATGMSFLYQLSRGFIWDRWNLVATLVDPPPVANYDWFGGSLAMDSQFCLIGASGKMSSTGAAFSFVMPPPSVHRGLPALVIILFVVAGVVGLSAIGIVVYTRVIIPKNKNMNMNNTSNNKKIQNRDLGAYEPLLQGSQRSDTAFMDMNDPSRHTTTTTKSAAFSGSSGGSLNRGFPGAK